MEHLCEKVYICTVHVNTCSSDVVMYRRTYTCSGQYMYRFQEDFIMYICTG